MKINGRYPIGFVVLTNPRLCESSVAMDVLQAHKSDLAEEIISSALSEYDHEEAQEVIENDVGEAINEEAGPFCYFGPGDLWYSNSEQRIGFWPDPDYIEKARLNGEIIAIEAGASWPSELGHAKYVLEGDPENVATLYDARDHTILWTIDSNNIRPYDQP